MPIGVSVCMTHSPPSHTIPAPFFLLSLSQVESLRCEFRRCDRACNGLITLEDLRASLAQQGLLGKGSDNVGLGKMLDRAQERTDGAGVIR